MGHKFKDIRLNLIGPFSTAVRVFIHAYIACNIFASWHWCLCGFYQSLYTWSMQSLTSVTIWRQTVLVRIIWCVATWVQLGFVFLAVSFLFVSVDTTKPNQSVLALTLACGTHLWLRQLVLSWSAICLWWCWHETSQAVLSTPL